MSLFSTKFSDSNLLKFVTRMVESIRRRLNEGGLFIYSLMLTLT